MGMPIILAWIYQEKTTRKKNESSKIWNRLEKDIFLKNTDSTENKNSGLFIVLNEIEGEGKEHY